MWVYFRFSSERVKLNCVTLSVNFEYLYLNNCEWFVIKLCGIGIILLRDLLCGITSYYFSIDLRFVCIFELWYRHELTVWTKRIFHGVMVRIGKVEPEGWPVRSGPSFSEVQITGLPEGSTFPILTNDPVIDYFSCLSTLIDHLPPQLNVFYTFT